MRQLRPQKQLIFHNPANGEYGDCYRTCIAICLGIDAEEVPHVCAKGYNVDDLDGIKAMRAWLATKGLAISKSVYNGELDWSAFQLWMERFNPNVALIVTAKSARGVNHCVVMIGGKVFCDPINGMANEKPFTGPGESDGEFYWWVETITQGYGPIGETS